MNHRTKSQLSIHRSRKTWFYKISQSNRHRKISLPLYYHTALHPMSKGTPKCAKVGQRCSVVFSALPDDGILRRVTEELLPALQSQGEGGPRKQWNISRKKFGNTLFIEFEGCSLTWLVIHWIDVWEKPVWMLKHEGWWRYDLKLREIVCIALPILNLIVQ